MPSNIDTVHRSSDSTPLFDTEPAPPQQAFLVFDRDLRVVYASAQLPSLLRLPDDHAVDGQDVSMLLAHATGCDPTRLRSLERSLHTSSHAGNSTEPLALLTSIDARTLHLTLGRIDDRLSIAELEDVTCTLSAERDMLAAAYRDPLTGIGNRALFEHTLDRLLNRIAPDDLQSVTLLFLDLDRFKSVNDTLGHAVGDALLRTVCERLHGSLRATDCLARLGGDEFAILLAPSSPREVASGLATRIIDLIQRPYLIDGQVINVGASIGIAIAPADGRTRDHLLRAADLALYHSKSAGRGLFHFFDPLMEQRAQQRRTLELDLRKALVLRQFELHYRPQIDAESQTTFALEGLLRWRHPHRGLVLPSEFIPLAEEIGLSIPIGDWVLRIACREASLWPDSVTVAVNVSPLHFEMAQFAASVERALTAADLPAHRLEIEVTEDILLRDGPAVLATLEQLRALGVRVAMDSFGTGIASLSQLVNFPFDKIKIDRSLLSGHQDVPGQSRSRAIVRAISALGESLGISTLAEGIESAEHLASVRSNGCDSVQGFYYSNAVPARELAASFPNLYPPPLASQPAPHVQQS